MREKHACSMPIADSFHGKKIGFGGGKKCVSSLRRPNGRIFFPFFFFIYFLYFPKVSEPYQMLKLN
jgi:hypothetical protein